jgi:hypothetical protein
MEKFTKKIHNNNLGRKGLKQMSLVNDFVYSFGRAALLLLVEV